MNRKTICVKQHGSNDCGVACLVSVARHYGLHLPLARIQYLASTSQIGTNALGIIQAATRLGFLAKGLRMPTENLAEIPTPAIAHVIIEGRLHYVVVYGVNAREVVVMDPQLGQLQRMSHHDFRRIWGGVLIVMIPGHDFQQGDETISPIRRVWRVARQHRSMLLQAFIGAALYTVLGLAAAVYVQKVVDDVFPSANRNLLNLLSVGMLCVLLVQLVLNVSQRLITMRVGRHIDGHLILGYYKHVLRLPHRFFNGRRVGDIVARVGDAVKIRALVSSFALSMLLNTLIIILATGLMLLYSWKLALLLCALYPVYGLVYLISDRINRTNQRVVQENAAELQSWLVESISGAATVRHLGVQQFATLQAESRLVRFLRTLDRAERTSIGSSSITEFLSRTGIVLCLWIGGGMVLDQTITPGELLSLYALLGYLSGPVGALVATNRDLRDALAAADRLYEILDLPAEAEPSATVPLSPGVGDIVFEGVSFRYGAGPAVLRDLSMRIPAGRITAVVGESGSGKSTLVSLLHKIEVPDGGKILLGGRDLAYVRTDSLRERIGVVPQRVDLFSGTVLTNIALGEFAPDMERVLDLSDRLGITEFVQGLPLGFDAPLGDNGLSLSGGQRQRIALARALYKDPDVLLLDEATSALDTAAERRIQQFLEEMRDGGRTVLLIAHRLATVVHADKIIVLRNGQVAEEGTHQELLRVRGEYFRLWQEQSRPDLDPGVVPLGTGVGTYAGAAGEDGPVAGVLASRGT